MKTILKVFTTILLSFLIFSCTNSGRKVKNFTLIGKVQDQDTCTLVLQYGILSTFHSDTIKVENSSFMIQGLLNEPTDGVLKTRSERIDLYLEPRDMNITLSIKDLTNFSLTGSRTQQELNDLNKSLKSVKNKDSAIINFVSNNPKSYLAPKYLYDLGYRKKISQDSLKLIFDRLDITVQNSKYGRITKGFIRSIENTTEGNFASDFKAIDMHGQPVTLSQFKNKNVVLLDFWASWCVPCQKSIPHLKALYKQYNSKGLEIISISDYDKSREVWESAIKKDSIEIWYQLATYFVKESAVSEVVNEDLIYDYPNGPIPRVILIDKDGKVLGNWVGYSEENEISLDKKLKTQFGK
jgi:thiol-disulfide isomerase/thioredoxin